MVSDKRVLARRVSKNRVYDVLFELIEQKDFGSITISELIEKSGIARSTFYRHFDSVPDVIEKYILCLDEWFEDTVGSDVDFNSLTYLTGVFKNYRIISKSLISLRKAGFADRFLQAVCDYHSEKIGDMPMNSPERYRLHYYAGAIYCVALEWIESGMKETRCV